jgi:hypothetical protein
MCHMIIMSTTSDLDLRKFNSSDVIFESELPGVPEEKLLKYDHKWYVGSYQGYSCGFRHLMSVNFPDLGFADPEEWFQENQENIDATLKLIKIFKEIIVSGEKLECIDAWSHDSSEEPYLEGNVIVNLNEVPDTAFRFIESFHHEFIYNT